MKSVECIDCIGRFLCHAGIKNGSEQCLTFHNVLESKLHTPNTTKATIQPCVVDTCIDRDYHKVCRMKSCPDYAPAEQ